MKKKGTKKEFNALFMTANAVSANTFNKLGLLCRRFVKNNQDIADDILDESYYLRAEKAVKNGESIQKNEKGEPILKAESEKEVFSAIKNLMKEEVEFEIDPVKIDPKLLIGLPANIFETLNGNVFICSEEEYFTVNELKE